MKVVLTFFAPGQTKMRVCVKVVFTFLAPGQTKMRVDRQEFV